MKGVGKTDKKTAVDKLSIKTIQSLKANLKMEKKTVKEKLSTLPAINMKVIGKTI